MSTIYKTHNHPNYPTRTARRQRGAILFISLVMLLLMTIIGVTAMNNVTMEERMAGNLRNSDMAFQAAEAALRTGEAWLDTLGGVEPARCIAIGAACATAWDKGRLPDLTFQDDAWWLLRSRPYANNAGGNVLTGGDLGSGPYVAANPEFLVEFKHLVRDRFNVGHINRTEGRDFLLVTARAHGGNTNTVSLMQTSYATRFFQF